MKNTKPTIIHLPSWFPSSKDPYSGNFIVRQIKTVADYCHAIVLTVDFVTNQQEQFVINCIDNGAFQQVTVLLKEQKRKNFLGKLCRKWRIFQAYQAGFSYIRKYIALPDLIHLHVSLPVGKVVLWWHFRYQIPYLITEHWSVYHPENFALRSFITRQWLRWIGNCAAQILPVTENLLSSMRLCGIKTQATVIPNVVDTDFFSIGEPSAEQPSLQKQILHVSTLNEAAKNVWGILHTIENLYAQRQDFLLQIVHDYPRPDLERYVKEQHLDAVVRFNGRKTPEELLEYYRNAAFVLLFSNYENQPCVLLEAFAMGKPVLATRVGAIPEMVNDERGCLIDPKDESALLKQLNRLLDTASSYLPHTIRQYVCRFTPQVVGLALADVYQKFIIAKEINE